MLLVVSRRVMKGSRKERTARVQISQLKCRTLWMRVTCVRGLKRSKCIKMRRAGLLKRAAGPLATPRGAST
ncbi:hypothetical protein GOODEAATRI_031996 [Goodea atripinnis]|uniref:Uncharacterized protein n=1 Tax=Goodea atripinnis TaxID=208336 RepID=A0ABV0NPT8_9TELE